MIAAIVRWLGLLKRVLRGAVVKPQLAGKESCV